MNDEITNNSDTKANITYNKITKDYAELIEKCDNVIIKIRKRKKTKKEKVAAVSK